MKEGEVTTRKLIIYAGVILLSLTTVLGIVANTGSFKAQVALEDPCLAVTDTEAQTAQVPDDCTGSGGGNNGDICLDDVVATTTLNNLLGVQPALAAIPKECDDVCEIDEQFPPAHDGATETAHQAGVTTLDSKKPTLDVEFKAWANDQLSPYFTATRRIIQLIGGGQASRDQANSLLNAFSSDLLRYANDPINIAKIQAGVLNPATLAEKAVYDALTLPKQDKHYRSDPHAPNTKREWSILNNFRPQFSGWPTNVKLDGITFDVLNLTDSGAGYSLCVEGGIGTASGRFDAPLKGLKLKGNWSDPSSGSGVSLSFGFGYNNRPTAGLFGFFRF